ncbi:unconventional myosin-Va isoform X1 [Diabrotica undecimpunctata]|uniref:unconventional myosin-Va isoform X1 n=1 Tax=Diabrotica undecimpunctata TaxID=50387 RepID=UPI003B631F7E
MFNRNVSEFRKGAKVWIPDAEKVWQAAELLDDYSPSKTSLNVLTNANETKALTIKSEKDLPFLMNPRILLGENDLTSLSYLHEPAVLHNLQYRFCQKNDIYTYCGIVLVAINPYTELPIYDTDTIQTYRGQSLGNLDPHVFAVAEEAYTKLEREQRDQSIIVSGESGAGKTVSAKYTMRYFATVGGSATETQVEKKVLASSPIMEAIGNAKTTRNDNSSRFGKFIELQFSKQFHISGASMRTYLLEKSRVVFQAPEERNYHIFYQLCSASKQLPQLNLDHQSKFHYLNQGKSPNVAGVDDLRNFEETVDALNLLGFSEKEQENMFKIIAAILHIGNIEFVDSIIKVENEQDQEGCMIRPNDKHLKTVTNLLEINEEEMEQWLCTKKLISMQDIFLKPMSVQDAIASRDALAKHIYSELFNWVVLMINRTLESEIPRHRFVGVLDIYGFETFEINSFEQFCINYANEKLQQQFNLHVFKLEQEEYIREGIEWKMIEFYDNQPCIDLIEAKLGILDLLDEECKMPRGSDASWTEKLYTKCSKYPHFAKARFGTSSFIVNHFADKVQYESDGFLDKNRDTVIEEQINVIRSSKNALVKKLFTSESQKLAAPRTKLKVVSAKPMPVSQKTHKQSVCSQFRDSLNKLMATLNATTPHYVRCIKPNDSKTAFEYEPKRAVQQLRACGVLETIRLSSAGFPSRWSYIDFFYRYRVLCKSKDIIKTDIQQTTKNILAKCIKDSSTYQFGKTKIFFRAGQVAYMEKLRSDKLRACCIMMQKTVRMFIYRKRYLRIKRTTLNIQRYGRGMLARRLAQDIRRTRAAIKIQKAVRGWVKRIQYQRLRRCILGIQTHARGYMARLRFLQLKYNAAALIIQKYVRGWLARKEYKRRIRKIIICQSAIRRYLARRQYKKLRIEARSIEHVKSLNKGLENKIISLQQKIDELNKTNSELKVYQNDVQDLKSKLQTFKAMELDIKVLNNLIIEKNKKIEKLETDVKAERDEKVDLINEQDRIRQEIEDQRQVWAQETAKLREELENMNEIVRVSEKGAEENLKVRLEEEKLIIMNEADSDREAYQRLLNEYHTLEQYCEELKLQMKSQGYQGFHKRNISDLSSISAIDEVLLNAEVPEDFGYGSVRSTTSSNSARERLENVDWKVEATSENHTPTNTSTSDTNTNQEVETTEPPVEQNVDVGLVLQLQHKLAATEREKLRMQKRLDEMDLSPKVEKAKTEAEYAIRISELELGNSQLKNQLFELQNSINEGQGVTQLHEQLATAQNELERRSEEIIQLKSVLANQTNNMKSILNSKTHTGQYINEDGELAQAYETQKTINKQLELELQDEKAKYMAYEKELKLENEKLQEENERQQRILSANLLGSGQTQETAFMQLEITRLATENLELRDKIDSLNENIRKIKKREKVLIKKLKEAGFDMTSGSITENNIDVNGAIAFSKNLPSIRKKDREYLGMFSFKAGDENNIMKQLLNLKPRTAVTLLPGLPAYIIFMCIRYTDYVNDEEKVKSLLSAFNNSLKKVIKKRVGDFETTVLWLANILRLVHTMKQYSGDKTFQIKNTPKQNEQSLRNFDLSEYRQVFTDNAVWIYHGLIKNFEEKIQSLIVPAILEHEEIPGISGNKPSGFRSRIGSSSSVTSPTGSQKPTAALLQELTNHYKILMYYGVDPEVISQIFKQIFYFLCATSLNNLLLRKELCHWSKGLQIRHNLSHFEMWTREKNFDEPAIQSTLQPIIQAAHLLQARKSEEDVASVCEMCSVLTAPQICKILNLYTPVDEFEQRVPAAFIKQVQAKLQERPDSGAQILLMDVKYKFPVRFVFNASVICLEEIEIPEILNLPSLEKL